MKIFNLLGADASRRTIRLWKARLKKAALLTVLFSGVAGGIGYAYTSGVFSRAGSWVHGEIIGATASAGFRVDDILVSGRKDIAQEELLTRLDIREGAPLFDVDIMAAQEKIGAIPWVKSVSVSRRLPSTITVDIVERTPVALWQYNQKLSAIDAEGTPLTSTGLGKFRHLPLVVGSGAQAHVGQMIDLLRAEPEIASRFKSAVRVGERRWDLHLLNGMQIKLPERDVELALRRLVETAAENSIFDRNIGVIDLRFSDRTVVELSPQADDKALKQKKTNI